MTYTPIILAILSLTYTVSAQTPAIPVEGQTVARSVQPGNVEKTMRYLADDKLEGRKPGTRGFELAAQYVESQFKKLGFKPMGQNGTFRQDVPLRRAQVRETGSTMAISRDGAPEQTLTYGKNFVFSPQFGQEVSTVFGSGGIRRLRRVGSRTGL